MVVTTNVFVNYLFMKLVFHVNFVDDNVLTFDWLIVECMRDVWLLYMMNVCTRIANLEEKEDLQLTIDIMDK